MDFSLAKFTKRLPVILAVIFLFFFWTDKIPLWSSDEGRYGEIAREMWEQKNFIVPHFNYLFYLEKPILAPLLTALSYMLFGVSSFSTRFPSVVSALLGVLVCYLFSRRLFSEHVADYTGLLLSTSVGYVLVGRFAVIDMLMTLFLSLSLFCLMIACLEGKRRHYFIAYFFMGLAFLTKGLIGVILPALVFLTFLGWTKKLNEIGKMSLGWGVLIFAAVICPWFIAISLKQPEFFDVFIIRHHFARFIGNSFGRTRPFWFFIPLLFATAFPWSLFIATAISRGLKQAPDQRAKIQFLVCWIVVIFLFFSSSRSKLPYYILPISMPISILVATLLSDWIADGKVYDEDRSFVWVWRTLPLVSLLGFLGLNAYLFLFAKDAAALTLKPMILMASLWLLAGSIVAFYFKMNHQPKRAIFSLVGMIYIGLILNVVAMKNITPFESTYAFAEVLNPQIKEGDAVAIFASPDRFSDFPFYLKRRVIVVGTDHGTLELASLASKHTEDENKWFLTEKNFILQFNGRANRFFCLMKEDRLPVLVQGGLGNFSIVKEGYGKVLISNF